LGKTAQTIAFLAWLKYRKTGGPPRDGDIDEDCDEDEDHQPHIIIVPASVLENWQREFEKFCPTMNVIK
jgi:SNF2 family DNA or RNA helicase